jgi:hypothetical protein
VELHLVEQWVGNCWKLKRLQAAETRAFADQAKTIRRHNDIDVRLHGRSPKDMIEPDATYVMRRLVEDGTLDKYQRYQQRLFSTMLRCSKELRVLQQEDVEPWDDDQAADEAGVQNEATAATEPRAQNEATAVPESVAQNEATGPSSPPKSSEEMSLPAVIQQPLTPRAVKLAAAVDATVHQSLNLNLKTAG